MKFFELNEENEKDIISLEINDYQMEFNEGNYEFWCVDHLWTISDELKFIRGQLEKIGLLELFKYFDDIENDHLSFGLPQLVQFCIACHCYTTMTLNKNDIEHTYVSSIPIGSIFFLDRILNSPKSESSKRFILLSINNLCLDVEHLYPFFARIVLRFGSKRWFTLWNQWDNKEGNNHPIFEKYKSIFETHKNSTHPIPPPNPLDLCVKKIILRQIQI